ncbi:MAG: phosphatidylglycerophosphatase A [Myxococcota bacterium]|nr:phosphatidylglycerophosphatase A [Myxococcota bacterium]
MSRRGGKLAWAIATWFGCGLVPKLPGTIGAIGAIPLYVLAARGGRAGVAVAAVVVIFVGVWAASVVARQLGHKDPQIIVIDEVAGVLVTMLPMRHASLASVAIGFALFRLFDITKPWPVRSLERLPGGWGIVLDDVGAGFLGAAALVLLQMARVLP